MSSTISLHRRVLTSDVTALRIVARSIVRELRKREYGPRHVAVLAGELIELACDAIRSNRLAAETDGGERRRDLTGRGDMTKQQIDVTWREFRALVAEKFDADVEGVRREAAFIADLGADSLDMIQVLMELEDRYQIAIPETEATRLVTVGDAYDYVVARMAA